MNHCQNFQFVKSTTVISGNFNHSNVTSGVLTTKVIGESLGHFSFNYYILVFRLLAFTSPAFSQEKCMYFAPYNPCLSSKIRHFMRTSREPNFSFSRLKINVFCHKLDTLCATRADPNFAFCALQSVFKVKNQTLYAPLARTRFFLFAP